MRHFILLGLAASLAACGGDKTAAPADSGAAAAAAAPAPATPVATISGETEYQVCAACHQANGQGLPPSFPPLAGSELLLGPKSRPIAIVLHGFQGEIVRGGTTYNGMMTAWGQLSDEQIAAILTYERSSWGNAADAVTAAEVAAVREATKDRTTPWTEKELLAATLP